ncbi:MAG: NAD(P)-dependent oxidoreductase [Candidatus Obscuribacterales bacterium]|nr:NAD(P)-dependent oxidoreductase [Candidatus Obscuribacterales bacterium]
MSDQAKRIAYLGMGIMGASMASNMAKSGFSVTVWNRTADKPELRRALESGARQAATLPEAVEAAEVVFLCLSDAPDLKQILLGEAALLDQLKPATTVLDMSTTGPICAQEIFAACALRNLHFLDAPVSGGDIGARNGTLTIMVGGERSSFDAVLPILQSIGKNIHYCGPAGSGQSVKLCNQILCAVNMLAVCESLSLAKDLGLDAQMIIDVCSSGAAASWALSNLASRIVKQDLEPGFMIKDMQKDLRLVMESIKSGNLDATALAVEKFSQAEELLGENGLRKGTQAMVRAYIPQ